MGSAKNKNISKLNNQINILFFAKGCYMCSDDPLFTEMFSNSQPLQRRSCCVLENIPEFVHWSRRIYLLPPLSSVDIMHSLFFCCIFFWSAFTLSVCVKPSSTCGSGFGWLGSPEKTFLSLALWATVLIPGKRGHQMGVEQEIIGCVVEH